ncbi:hypothetical protein C7271_05880, partial [filamentous cyanobacterium CCP5]
MNHRNSSWLCGSGLWGLTLLANPVWAQSVQVDSSGLTSLGSCGPDCTTVESGLSLGNSLFHSFQEFSLAPGSTVRFIDPGVRHIFSRVTGSHVSSLNGTLAVAGGNANLILLNPNGIVFGSMARLGIGGSFLATTANAIELVNGDRFSANINTALPSQLVRVDPSALLFNQLADQTSDPTTGLIDVQEDGFLSASPMANLLLAGRRVRVDSILRTAGGRLVLGATTEGRVESQVSASNSRDLQLAFGPSRQMGNVFLNSASLTALNGAIAIHGNQVDINDSTLAAPAFGGQSSVTISAEDAIALRNSPINNAVFIGSGGITLQAGRSVSLEASSATSSTLSNNNGGTIAINTGSLSLSGGSSLTSNTRGLGDAGG